MTPTLTMMKTTEFYRWLEQHDWTYQYSDDHSVYRRGATDTQLLRRVASSDTTGILQDLYDRFHKHIFSGEPFRTPRAQRPDAPAPQSIVVDAGDLAAARERRFARGVEHTV